MTTRDLILHQQRDLVGEADADVVGQAGSLAEVDKILERECKGDGLLQLNFNVFLGLVHIGVTSEGDGGIADIAVA